MGMNLKLVNARYLEEKHPDMHHSIVGFLSVYYEELKKDRLLRSCFYDGSVKCFEDFVSICLDKRYIFMLVWDVYRKEYVAHTWLAGFEGLMCRVHFGVLRKAHGEYAVPMAKEAARMLFDIKRTDGVTPLTRTLVGLTPETNKLALRFIDAVGYKRICTIEDACYIESRERYVPGVLSILTR